MHAMELDIWQESTYIIKGSLSLKDDFGKSLSSILF